MGGRQGIDHGPIFDSSSTPMLVLDPQLVIVTANRSYLALTNRRSIDIVGAPVFEVFPDNPDATDTVGEAGVRASFQHVFETATEHRMGVYRYDLARPDEPGAFEKRYWSMTNAPILGDDGEVTGVVHSVEDVTAFRDDLTRALEFYRAAVEGEDEPDAHELDRRFARYAGVTAAGTQLYSDLVAEVDHLRRALTSRAVIDQAKGVLMARYGCDADQAFATLSRMSQEENLKLRELAEVLLRQVRQAGPPPGTDGEAHERRDGEARRDVHAGRDGHARRDGSGRPDGQDDASGSARV